MKKETLGGVSDTATILVSKNGENKYFFITSHSTLIGCGSMAIFLVG